MYWLIVPASQAPPIPPPQSYIDQVIHPIFFTNLCFVPTNLCCLLPNLRFFHPNPDFFITNFYNYFQNFSINYLLLIFLFPSFEALHPQSQPTSIFHLNSSIIVYPTTLFIVYFPHFYDLFDSNYLLIILSKYYFFGLFRYLFFKNFLTHS